MRTMLLFGAIVCFGLPVWGQTLGEITGRISDPSGAGIPDAALTLTSVTTNAVRQTTTTNDGDYSFPSVPPGIYKVKAEHPGFKTMINSNVEVQVQQTVRLDLTLQVGQVTESIEVPAAANMLQAENATVGTVIANQSLTELPLNGREYLNLVALTSNVNTLSPAAGQAGSRQGGDRASQSISTGGNRIMFDYFTLDGVSNTDFDFNTYVVLPSIDAIQEFKVQTGVYPAEFGHEATQINVLTKSGGNLYHASLVRVQPQRRLRRAALPVHHHESHGGGLSTGTIMATRSMVPCGFRSCSTAGTNSSSCPISKCSAQRQNAQSVYSVPTAAMFQATSAPIRPRFTNPARRHTVPGQHHPDEPM